MLEIINKTYYGNSIGEWLIAFTLIAFSLIIGKILYWFSSTMLKRFTRKTETKFEVDSPKINLGAGAVEPVVLGNQLKKCLELICDAIQNGTYTGGGGVHSYTTIPLVSAVKSQIANILSGVSKTK